MFITVISVLFCVDGFCCGPTVSILIASPTMYFWCFLRCGTEWAELAAYPEHVMGGGFVFRRSDRIFRWVE